MSDLDKFLAISRRAEAVQVFPHGGDPRMVVEVSPEDLEWLVFTPNPSGLSSFMDDLRAQDIIVNVSRALKAYQIRGVTP
jgi:hypothetical protein